MLRGLRQRLSDDPQRLCKLLRALQAHHDLQVVALDAHAVRVSMNLAPGLVAAGGDVPTLVVEGEAGEPPMTADEWAAQENQKGHYCKCGCGGRIEVVPRHRMGVRLGATTH